MSRARILRTGAGTLRAMRLIGARLMVAVALTSTVCVPVAFGQDIDRQRERAVKAAFIYRFVDFIEWPASAFRDLDSPVVIGIVDAPDIHAELAPAVAGRRIGGRPIEVRQIRSDEPLPNVHLLFVDNGQRHRMGAFAGAARTIGALSVADTEGALQSGIVINFITVDGRVRFEVSLGAAASNGLRLSSRLLAVAYRVVPNIN